MTAINQSQQTANQPPERATLGGDTQSRWEQFALALFIVVPFAAFLVAVPVAWGGWLGWSDILITLVILGSMAIEGPVARWVADHRKHHKFSDRDGDPHSPWRYGNTMGGLIK